MLQIREEYVDKSGGYRLGSSGWYERFTEDRGKLFRALQKEYGGCVSKVYVDRPDGEADPIGWVFEKRVKYTDCDETYVQEVWVTLREVFED